MSKREIASVEFLQKGDRYFENDHDAEGSTVAMVDHNYHGSRVMLENGKVFTLNKMSEVQFEQGSDQ